MKTIMTIVLASFLFLSWVPLASAHNNVHGDHQSQGYTCPMHPEVSGVKGDTCPKCDMNLEAVKAADKAASKHNCPNHGQKAHKQMHANSHACPMHPEVSGVKGDTCPKCGMNLEAVKAADKTASKHNCPNGDTCPKCSKNLEADITADKHHSQNCDSCPNHGKKAHKQMHANSHACPMHPEVSGVKGDTCPKCGMNLTAVNAENATELNTHHTHH